MAFFKLLTILFLLGLTACSGNNPQMDFNNIPETAAGIPEAATGVIKIQRWDNLSGSDLNDLLENGAYPDLPDANQRRKLFYYRPRVENFGAQIRAELFPDMDGAYYFSVVVKGSANVWLSTDESEINKRLILRAIQPSETSSAPELISQSTPIAFNLNAGQRYYLEVQYKGVTVKDYVKLTWLTPGANEYIAIPGESLAPYPVGYYETDANEFGYGYSAGYRNGYLDSRFGIDFSDTYPLVDTDNDSIPDTWETALGYDPLNADDALVDDDGDGLITAYEFWAGTEPFEADSDGDGILDGDELTVGSDPLDSSVAIGGTAGSTGATGATTEDATGIMTISWDPPTTDTAGGPTDIKEYSVLYSQSSDLDGAVTVTVIDPTVTIEGLVSGTTYYIQVIAVDHDGQTSAPSDTQERQAS